MIPYIIAGAIGFVIAKALEEDEAPKYDDGGNVLLATNGKPSNLTPEQYKLVRTKAFKDWFGDWESKQFKNNHNPHSEIYPYDTIALDENGEPRIWHRATNYDYTEFDTEYIYLGSNKSYVKQYGKPKEFFIKPKKTIFIDNEDIERQKLGIKFDYLAEYITDENAIPRKGKNYDKLKKAFENQKEVLSVWQYFTLVGNKEILNLFKNWFNEYGFDSVMYWETGLKNNFGKYPVGLICLYFGNQIKLADGTNTTFDGNNPDIRFDGGGVSKKSNYELYNQLIDGYELALEIESDEEKIKMYRNLIDGYKLALELEEEQIQEVEPIQEEMNQEVAQDDFEPSYLMTLDEYKEKVTPLIQAYKKFLRKNSNYFISPDYYGLAKYTLQEALELKDSPNAVFLGSYGRQMSTEKQVRYNYSYKKTRDFDDKYTEPLVPQKLVDENKEFIKKLQKYFSIDDLNSRVQDDETKSNKRAIRRAIDDGIYKDLLSDNKVELSKLERIAESVGIRLPKSIFDKSTQNQMKYEAELSKLLADIPILSFQKLKQLINEIKIDLIPLEELVYEQEYARYTELIKENIGKTKKAQSFGVVIPVWNLVYNYESEYKRENTPYKDWKGDYITESVQYVKFNGLTSDWEKQLASYLKEYVDNLKNSIIIAIMRNFQNINMPIKSTERLSIKVGKKGFEGSYKFTFENGSSFVMNFQGVGAGGFNIQSYHFRYLTNFSDVKLADGSKGGTNYYEIVDKFSTKR